MPELHDDKRELNESLDHKIAIYGLPLVLERLGAVITTPRAAGGRITAVRELIALELDGLATQAREAGEGEPDQ